jgi:hypothetical protein
MGALIRMLARKGFRQGLGGGPGGKGWLAVGLAAATVQYLRRKAGEPKVDWTTELKPGQTMTIHHFRKGEAPED